MKLGLIIIFFSLFLTSCWKTETLRTIDWKDNKIVLSVSNGGATTSWLWKINIIKHDFLFDGKSLIFQSYSTPFVEDIKIVGDTLQIVCSDGHNKTNIININLGHLDTYINNPVKYCHDILENTNKFHKEPKFIKDSREFAITNGLQ